MHGIAVGSTLLFATLLYLTGFAQGRIPLAIAFGAFFALTVGTLVAIPWLRRPHRLGFSASGVLAEYRSGRTRLLPWETIAHVDLDAFLGDVSALVRRATGGWETKAYILGRLLASSGDVLMSGAPPVPNDDNATIRAMPSWA
jgi:hypothetical protein